MPTAGLRDRLSACAGLLGAAGLCIALAACQSTNKPAGPRPTAQTTGGLKIKEAEPFAGLKSLAARQAATPDSAAKTMAPPPGVDPAEVAPLTELSPDSPAMAPLDTVLAKFASEAGPAPESHTPNQQAL